MMARSGKWVVKRLHGGFAVAVGLDRVAVARQRRGVILAQCRLILDDRDVLFHGSNHSQRSGLEAGCGSEAPIIRHDWSDLPADWPLFAAVRRAFRSRTLTSYPHRGLSSEGRCRCKRSDPVSQPRAPSGFWSQRREASLNWLALGLLLAAWNAADNDPSPTRAAGRFAAITSRCARRYCVAMLPVAIPQVTKASTYCKAGYL